MKGPLSEQAYNANKNGVSKQILSTGKKKIVLEYGSLAPCFLKMYRTRNYYLHFSLQISRNLDELRGS